MILIILKKATKEEIKKMSHEYGNYIKVVVDMEKGILAGGSVYHYEEEQELLEYGSLQKNLWGGGVDLETNQIDYNSMINVRPNQDNPSRDILSKEIRQEFNIIVKNLIPI